MGRFGFIGYDSPVPGPVQAGFRPTSSGGDPSATGIEKLGNVLTDLGNKLDDDFQQSRANQELADAQRLLQDFTFSLRHGTKDENGNVVAPPDPDLHSDLYRSKLDEITGDVEKRLNGRALASFQNDFRAFAQRQEFAVKENAIDQYNARIKANNDDFLDKAAVTYVNGTDLEKPDIQNKVFGTIDDLVNKGAYTPEEGLQRKRRFVQDAEGGSFLRILKSSPDNALAALDRGEFKDLPADTQERYRNMAKTEQLHQITLQNQRDDRKFKLEERALKKTHEEYSKRGIDLIAKGQLTPDWVSANRENLDVEHYTHFMDVATGRGTKTNNPSVQSDLIIRAASGENVVLEAVTQANRGNITSAAVEDITKIVIEKNPAVKSQNKYLQGLEYIKEATKPVGMQPDPGSEIRRAKAVQEWIDWSADPQNQKASPEEKERVYKHIVENYALVDFQTKKLGMDVPFFLEGGRAALSGREGTDSMGALQRAAQQTQDALEKGRITPEYARKQFAIINRWRQILQPLSAKPTTQTK